MICGMLIDNPFPISINFPDPEKALPEGIVCAGGELTLGNLIQAYSLGIFPWPHEDYPLLWFSPEQRGVLDLHEIHISRTLVKEQRRNSHWIFKINTDFLSVIKNCQIQKRPGQDGTWISEEIIQAYVSLFNEGLAWCAECYDGKKLIGGVYGVKMGAFISGESMFFKKDNASKLAFWFAMRELQNQGYQWIDIQMLTSVTQGFGGKYIARKEFLNRLKALQIDR